MAILISCKKTPEVNMQYVDIEREVLTIGQTTATFQCDYQYISTLKSAKLYYGIGEASNYVEMRVVQSTLYAEISGLNGGTTYKYYYEFTNGFNSMQSEAKTFVTGSSPFVVLPTVITANVTEITTVSAICGGEVTNNGGGNITARGICWSTSANPTINDSHTTDGSGIGLFVSNIIGLTSNTTYHVRAYATNEAGIAYGLDEEFVTLGGGTGVPTGAINGLFTINENGDQVYFSQGNLQYQASTNTWRFAENQWDYVGSEVVSEGQPGGNVVGSSNHLISSNYNGWIDLLGWGTSGYNHGAIAYQPWSTSSNPDDYWAYGIQDIYLPYQDGRADWGYNPISNGGNTTKQWRTLSNREWYYLLELRITSSGIRWTYGTVHGVHGIIVVPDNLTKDNFDLIENHNTYSDNIINATEWKTLENDGTVFLPAAGLRSGQNVVLNFGRTSVRYNGCYWSSTCNENSSAVYGVVWSGNYPSSFYNTGGTRCDGYSVRLIHDINPIATSNIELPQVITKEITGNVVVGEVVEDGGSAVLERGFVVGQEPNPIHEFMPYMVGSGLGYFSKTFDFLVPNTTYYVRAYAINAAGIAYGDNLEFTAQ